MFDTSAASRGTSAFANSGYLPGLDGLRGVVAMMVVFFHLNLLGLGWTGVSCFFVLSGFLITRILLDDIEASKSLGACLKRFYIRRTLRVFPLYYLYLVVLLAVSRIVPVVHDQASAELPYAFGYVYNLFMMTSHHHGTHLMDHLWSLSVEEQFYLVWPLVMYFAGRRHLPLILGAVIILSPLVRWATVAHWPLPGALPWVPAEKVYFATYFSTFSNFDGFAFGALLNFVRIRPRLWWLAVSLAATYLIAIPLQGFGLAPIWQFGPPLTLGYPISLPEGHQYAWGYSAIYLNCALLVLLICDGNVVQRLFSHPWLGWLGKRSYAIYIVHYPLLFAMEPLLHAMQVRLGASALTTIAFAPLYVPVVLFVAHVLHVGFEKPILTLKDRFASARPVPISSGVAPATAVVAAPLP